MDSLLDMIRDGDENDADDDIPSWFKLSSYYDNDAFIDLLKNKQCPFNIISLNCQSLNAKFDQISVYIESLRQQLCNIDALCVQETWLNDNSSTSHLQIEGYNLITKSCSCSAHGGVAIYLNDQLNYRLLSVSSQSNTWDGMFLEIDNFSNANRSIIIGNIYRPPHNNVANYRTFFDEMNEILHNFQRQKKEILIAGDFNLDLLKINENQHIKEYFDLIMANGFLPKITLPTRLTHQGGTLIDNIFVKLSNHCVETTAGILLQQISDHQPCFLIFDTFQYNHVSCKTVKVYTNDSESISKFKDEMAYQCSLDRYGEDNPNANYDILHNSITTSLAKHLPIKTVRFNKHKHKRMKWITHGIIRSVKYRDKLYGKMKKARTEQEYYLCKTNLQTYNRILKQTIRNAKKQYYQTCFNNYRDDIRKTWKTINDVLGRVPKSVENPKYFTVNNETVTNPESIANEFNKYFVNIGSELANKIIMPDNKNYKDYLTIPVETVFEFKNTNRDEVVKIIDKLKPKTSCGWTV
jgi:hypothetical protein